MARRDGALDEKDVEEVAGPKEGGHVRNWGKPSTRANRKRLKKKKIKKG